MISIIQKPVSFKIRRKSDIKTFKNVCLCNGSKYIIKINPNYIFMLEKMENQSWNSDWCGWMGLEIAEIYQQKIFFVENIILSVEMKHSPIRFILFRAERQKSSFAMYMIKGRMWDECI